MSHLANIMTCGAVTILAVSAAGFSALDRDWSTPGILVLMAATGGILAAIFWGL